jgi:hypothetical protein
MSEEQNLPPPPPNDGDKSFLKIIWLFAAFVPSVIGIACLHIRQPAGWLYPVLTLLNLFLSVAAAGGLVRGMKQGGMKTVVAFFLFVFFFVLNALIVVFVGCSGTGRIAP